ncbi:hypothetical protein O1C93_000234 [Vibrio cholerae]|nr:hypothetical protein [Vibrio cholerae]
MKIAYLYDPQTFFYSGFIQVHKLDGYDHYILPQLATWIAPQQFDEKTHQARFNLKASSWVVEPKLIKVTAYLKSDCTKQKEFDDVTLVTDDYTLKEPATRFDEWIDGEWVTDVQSQYQWQVNQVSETRYRLYLEVDRLRNEAVSIAETENDLDKAREYKLQADALYLKIRAENPWPVNPEA